MFLALLLSAHALASEPELLQKYPKIFQRRGDTLTLFINGDSKKYQDALDGDDGRVRTTAVEYFPAAKAAVLRHAFVGSELYDVVSTVSGRAIHAGSEAPQWKNGVFASPGGPRLLIGLCDSRGCEKLVDEAASGPAEILSRDRIRMGESRICKVNRRARTAACAATTPKGKN